MSMALIPHWGAEFYTICGEAKTLAKVLLAPGDGLSRHHRRLAEAHPLVKCSVRADWEAWRPAPPPDAFHRVTLRWAIENASHIVIWSAPFPEYAEEVGNWHDKAIQEDARFVVTIETTPGRANEWISLVQRWKRRSAAFRVFGPGDTEPETLTDRGEGIR
jgi:hypothetical protein